MRTLLSRANFLEIENGFKKLIKKHWLPKMHRTSAGVMFIIASRKFSTEGLPKTVTKTFIIRFKEIQSFHEKWCFYSDYKLFWIFENTKHVIDGLDQRNTKNNARCISAFDYSTPYTKLPHKDLLKVLLD